MLDPIDETFNVFHHMDILQTDNYIAELNDLEVDNIINSTTDAFPDLNSPSSLDRLINELPDILQNVTENITRSDPPPHLSIYHNIEQQLINMGFDNLTIEEFQSVVSMIIDGSSFDTVATFLSQKDLQCLKVLPE